MCSTKRLFKKSREIHRKTFAPKSLFNKVVDWRQFHQKKPLQHRCFTVKFGKLLRAWRLLLLSDTDILAMVSMNTNERMKKLSQNTHYFVFCCRVCQQIILQTHNMYESM